MSNILGVDIGQSSIKVVSVNKDDGKGFILETLGEVKTPSINWRNGDSKGLAEVAGSLKNLISDLKIKSKQAVANMPENEVVSRLVRLPPLKESEIRDVLKFEAETFVPYPLDQVSIDYEIIEKDDAGRLSVFVIAAQNSLIQTYVKLFKMVGLELVALESSSVTIKRIMDLSIGTKNGVIVLDIGDKTSDIISLNNGNVYFARSLAVGGESITRAISINLSLDMASAEEYKKAYGLKEMELEGKIRASIMPVFQNISEEIRKAIALFLEEHGKPVDILVLSGGGAHLPGLAEELTRVLGVEVQVIQPFVKINTSKSSLAININTDGCRFGIATGLALRGMI
jgi:type IV pilus assembly protein PilM